MVPCSSGASILPLDFHSFCTGLKMVNSMIEADPKTDTLLLEGFSSTGGGAAFSFQMLLDFFSPSIAFFLVLFASMSSLQALTLIPLESSYCGHDVVVVVV
jgi:hypothetical protein